MDAAAEDRSLRRPGAKAGPGAFFLTSFLAVAPLPAEAEDFSILFGQGPGETRVIQFDDSDGNETWFMTRCQNAVSPDYYIVIREFGEFIPLKKGKQISAQQLLERFLFDRKKQYDFVEKLSGGERKRLYLCTVLIQNPNFLILDEPTNDLDIVTLNVLENFLLDFPGCLIVVSHDRYFMDKIVDHLFVFRGNTEIEDFPGNYSDFREYEANNVQESQKTETAAKKEWKKTPSTGLSYNEQKEYQKLQKEIHNLEK